MSNEQWFCQLDGEQVGPVDATQLRQLVVRGRVTPETLVRTASRQGWVPAGRVKGLEFGATETAASDPVSKSNSKSPRIALGGTSAPSTKRAAASADCSQPVLKRANPLEINTPSLGPGGALVELSAGAPQPVPPPISDPAIFHSPRANVSSVPLGQPKLISGKRQAARRQLVWMIGGSAGVLIALGLVGLLIALSGRADKTRNANQVAHKGLADEFEEADQASGQASAGPGIDGAADAGTADETRPQNENSKQIAAAAPQDRGTESAGDTRPGTTNAALPPTTDGAAVSADANKRGPARGDVAAALKSVNRWFDLSQSSSISSKSLRLQVTGVWEDGPPGESRLFIELRITNSQTDLPLNYLPWNGTGSGGAKAVALLVDSTGNNCPLVPRAAAPHAMRQTAPLRIRPGESVQDLLVFELSQEDFEAVQLMLPAASVGQGKRYIGLRIPRENIAAAPFREGPAGAIAGPGDASDNSLESTLNPATVPEPAAKPTAAAAKPAPESLDDLRRSIAESVKEKESEREKLRADQRDANKKAKNGAEKP